jgi:hypothetical protein
MIKETKKKDSLNVDKGLVAMFLKMSPEERLQANDNAARAILLFYFYFYAMMNSKKTGKWSNVLNN